MSFLEDAVPLEKVVRTHTLWVEKYRPSAISGYIGNQPIKDMVEGFITKQDIPHLLFYGKAGTGKSTVAKIITNSIKCDSMYINASDENNVDTVRNKIKDFASNAGFSELKVVVLDEADFLTLASQSALRNMMEAYALTTRFILTCNYVEKIIEPLVSRCQAFEITPLNKKDVAIHLKNILELEKVSYKIEDVVFVVNSYYPDIRKILNFAQQSVSDNSLKLSTAITTSSATNENIINILKTDRSRTGFSNIRQLVADSDIRHFEDLYQLLFDRVDEYSNGNPSAAILVIAEYVYQSALVVNKEIMFMACISKLMEAIK